MRRTPRAFLRYGNCGIATVIARGPDAHPQIEYGEEEIAIQSGDDPAISAPTDGEVIEHETDEGDIVELRTYIEDGVLHQRIDIEQGSYTAEYRLDNDGQQLSMDVKLDFEQLPEVISYRLIYDRA